MSVSWRTILPFALVALILGLAMGPSLGRLWASSPPPPPASLAPAAPSTPIPTLTFTPAPVPSATSTATATPTAGMGSCVPLDTGGADCTGGRP